MSMEGNFEKTRIQDPDKAHEEANMLRVEVGENPTPEDYEKALEMLRQLEEEASHGSVTLDRLTKPFRNAVAGIGSISPLDLLQFALLGIARVSPGYSRARWVKEELDKKINELKQTPERYKFAKKELSTARERLEQWKAEAAVREQE